LVENGLLWREKVGENILLWRVKVGRERTAVENEWWERTDCCGE